jgi:K(+)-stimulated pyrophosphate-energized sodium pump
VTDKVANAGGYMPAGWSFTNINLAQMPVFVGALLGAMLTYLFSSMAIKAVGRTAEMVVKDVRDQFKENPGIMAGTSKPDYARCVNIVTGAALKEMVLPGLLAVGLPVAVGLDLPALQRELPGGRCADSAGDSAGADDWRQGGEPGGGGGGGGLLMVGTISGVLLAMLMNNGGGAWDNAKKFIETGQYGGKKSEAHKAAVVGDTVGDPFKDTAGPSLHVLIKLLATITLVLAPLFV